MNGYSLAVGVVSRLIARFRSEHSAFQIDIRALAGGAWISLVSLHSAQVAHGQVHVERLDDGLHVTMRGAAGWEGFDPEEVVSLDLNNLDLKSEDVLRIAGMRNMKELSIGALPEKVVLQCDNINELGKLEKLQSLSICVSSPRVVSLNFVENLKKVESFSLICDDDRKDFNLTDSISKMEKLRRIDLKCRNIKDTHVAALVSACDLASITIHSDLITNGSIQSILAQGKANEIDVSSPLLTDDAGRILGEIQSLSSVSIASGKITGGFIGQIKDLNNLKRLSISVQAGSAEVFEALRKLGQLESLEVSCARPDGFDISRIASHPNLRRFFVRGVEVTKEAKEIVRGLPKLEYAQIGNWAFKAGE